MGCENEPWAIIDVGNMATLDALLSTNRPAYLVTGKRQKATGIDGEPLLRAVKIVKPVEYSELYVRAWGNDPLPEEYLNS